MWNEYCRTWKILFILAPANIDGHIEEDDDDDDEFEVGVLIFLHEIEQAGRGNKVRYLHL